MDIAMCHSFNEQVGRVFMLFCPSLVTLPSEIVINFDDMKS